MKAGEKYIYCRLTNIVQKFQVCYWACLFIFQINNKLNRLCRWILTNDTIYIILFANLKRELAQIDRVRAKPAQLTLVLFEFYLTARRALTNSIPLSGGAADVSGFVRSGFARRRSIRQGETDDATWWRYTKVLRRPHHDDPATTTFLPSFASLSLFLPSFLPCAISFHPPLPRASPRLTGEAVLRGASLFWLPYFTDSEPSALPLFHYPPFYPFSPLSPHPFPSPSRVFTLVTLPLFVLAPMCYA